MSTQVLVFSNSAGAYSASRSLTAAAFAASGTPAFRAVICSDVCTIMARTVLRSAPCSTSSVLNVRRSTSGPTYISSPAAIAWKNQCGLCRWSG